MSAKQVVVIILAGLAGGICALVILGAPPLGGAVKALAAAGFLGAAGLVVLAV